MTKGTSHSMDITHTLVKEERRWLVEKLAAGDIGEWIRQNKKKEKKKNKKNKKNKINRIRRKGKV